ncbi:MAG: SPOR domain-containing protein [Bacteroidales bacterium]|nr:SPOR domain-containing protein [Bacteroidales bacterium]
MKYHWIILTILGCMIGGSLLSQPDGGGNVVIIQDPGIDTILQKHVQMNEALLLNTDNYAIDGYRIQIFEESGNKSSTRAREVMAEFSVKYPDIPVYLTWQAPNFKVRVGDFGTRMSAEGFLNKIKRNYPIAWVIRDKIKYPVIN